MIAEMFMNIGISFVALGFSMIAIASWIAFYLSR